MTTRQSSIYLTVFAMTLTAVVAKAEMSISGTNGGTLGTAPQSSQSVPLSAPTRVPMTTTSVPQAGTSAGSPQTAGPLNAAPNGMAGTNGYPNAANDPNTTNPGLPQPTYYGSPSYNYGGGTTSGTTTSVNPAGAPFVTPPAATSPGAGTRPIR